jgi:hypothetical protein
VALREDFPDGAVQTALVSSTAGGPIAELAVGRSSLGDGLVAFQQGQLGDAAIAGTEVSAPPKSFLITVPKGWVKPSQASVSWVPAVSANGPITYTVVFDGRRVATPAGRASLRFNAHGLADGVHEVQLLATDVYGQSTLTPVAALSIDGSPPVVTVRRTHGGHAVLVRVSDAQSGVAKSAVTISFGDGGRARGRTSFSHRYAHGGVYRILVHVRDKLGNEGNVTQVVSVP